MTRNGQAVRMGVVVASVIGAFIALGFRLDNLHRGNHDATRAEIMGRQDTREELRAPRGRILGRNGRVLATDKSSGHVGVDPRYIFRNSENPRTARAGDLAAVLGLPPAAVGKVLGLRDTQFQRLQRFADEEALQALRESQRKGGMRGVILESVSMRRYPLGSSAAQIVGYSSSMGRACAGVELSMNALLTPVGGYRECVVDGKGNEMATLPSTTAAARPGADVHLTLDEYLQHMVDREMETALTETHATAAWAILMKVDTGEILAMVSKPGFDPNEGFDFASPARVNHAIMTCFEPGSVMKIVPFAAALEEGLATPSTPVDCEFGTWMYAGKPLRDVGSYGTLSFADAFMKSSNIGTSKISVERLGVERLNDYMHRFGMGRKLGIELPDEEAGIFHPPARWSKLSLSRLAIGQGIAATALQMVNAVNTIANGGILMKPSLVLRVTSPEGHVLREFQPEALGRAISPRTAETMRWMMARVCTKTGTARRATMDHYLAAGKTGTAQKPVPGGYSSTDYIASFAGFVPADRPVFSLIVSLDSPRPLHQGGVVAAPVFKRIAEEAVRYLRVPPSTPEEMAAFLAPRG